MMNRVLKAAYIAGIIFEMVVRAPIERQRRQLKIRDERVSRTERGLLGLLFVGTFALPMLYIVTPWLNRANYRWSATTKARAGGLGTLLFGAGLWVFWRSHADLGQNWSPSLEINEQQTLVTRGIYGHIRHPMYASHMLWSIGQMLLLQNWLAGPVGLLLFLPLYFARVPREEQMMLDHFGDEYRAYMERTGRVIPRIRG